MKKVLRRACAFATSSCEYKLNTNSVMCSFGVGIRNLLDEVR